MSGASSFVGRVVEFYTLRQTSSAQDKLGPARAEVAELAELSRQRGSAAEALFAVGHTIEALRLGIEALDASRSAVDRFGEAIGVARGPMPGAAAVAPPPAAPDAAPDAASATAEGSEAGLEGSPAGDEGEPAAAPVAPALEPAWRAVLRAALVSPSVLEATVRTVKQADEVELPRLESGVAPTHAVLFREIMRARAVLEAAVAPATLSRAEIGFTRVWRPLVTAVLVLGATFGLVSALRPVEGTFVRVSATWADSPDFRADFAIDGNDTTMWLLPNGETGFLEVRFVPGRRIERISLVNAGGLHVPDRATHEYTLEIWSDGAVAQTIRGEFADELGGHAEHPVGIDDVERIRFVVLSHHRVSAGLSELRWE